MSLIEDPILGSGDEEEPADSAPLLAFKPDPRQGIDNPVMESHAVKMTIDPLYTTEEVDDDYYMKFSPKYKRRRVELVFSNAALLILDYLQIYALIFSMALRWTWPEQWSYYTRFLFFFNLDVWDFTKLQLPNVYKAASDYFIPSSEMVIDYRYLLLAWGLFVFFFVLSFICFYIAFNMKKRPNMLVKLAKLKRAYIIMCHIFAMPFGVVIARLFFCTPYVNKLDVYNDYSCWSGIHWAFICPFMAVVIMYYIVYPIWLITKVKPQMLTTRGERHEGYVQLKETEYAHSLSTLWLINSFYLFSSFKRFWVYYHPVMHIFKFVLIMWYAALLYERLLQAVLFSITLLVLFIVICIKRPFRPTSFNFYIIFSFVCLSLLSWLGLFQNIPNILSAFLTPSYLIWVLVSTQGIWFSVTVIWLLYLLCRYFQCCCSNKPLWPRMTSHGLDDLGEYTRKYMQALLHGRIILEYALSIPPLFSPAYELSRQIHIINAYCREAELLRDPIHDALWDLLDELIEAHSKIAPLSLFSESVKQTIRETAAELMRIMPPFKKRLLQREYDFCLMSPLKRRMLLKMYIIGVFVNERRDKNRDYRKADVVKKLYNPKESVVLQTRDTDEDDGYYDEEDIEFGIGPTGPRATYTVYRPETAQTLDLMSDDELAEWERLHQPSRADSLSSLTDSIDLNALMAGVPSLPASSASNISRPDSSASRAYQTTDTYNTADIESPMTDEPVVLDEEKTEHHEEEDLVVIATQDEKETTGHEIDKSDVQVEAPGVDEVKEVKANKKKISKKKTQSKENLLSGEKSKKKGKGKKKK
ncbi:uncharacterized protein LOC144436390 [Glandiceps talaboti]